MELFERIRYLCETKDISLAKLARNLDVVQQTFHKWLTPSTQKHLYDYLPQILKLFPDVREEWLYIGREPAFKDGTCVEKLPTQQELQALQIENNKLQHELAITKQELADADRLNRQLTKKILVSNTGCCEKSVG